jgi:serine protease Do
MARLKSWLFIWLVSGCLSGFATHAPAQDPTLLDARGNSPLLIDSKLDVDRLVERNRNFKQVMRAAAKGVVHIEAIKLDTESARENDTFTEAGSGAIFVYDNRFYVLTNLHVVKDADLQKINIMLSDRRFFRPQTLLSDPDTDLAVMRVDFPDLEPCKIADSDTVEAGDFVFAIGSPFGLSQSLTYGIVSARGRHNLELGDEGVKYQDFIQTDAAINPGNSGGPLMNLQGEVIGINTAIASNSGGNDGIGFSIPINMATNIARELIEHGRVRRSFLGVTLDSDFTLEKAGLMGLTRFYGARVMRVTGNSPAYFAGMESNDLILEFNGTEILDDAHLVNVVSMTPPGNSVSIVVLRDRRRMTLNAKVQEIRQP